MAVRAKGWLVVELVIFETHSWEEASAVWASTSASTVLGAVFPCFGGILVIGSCVLCQGLASVASSSLRSLRILGRCLSLTLRPASLRTILALLLLASTLKNLQTRLLLLHPLFMPPLCFLVQFGLLNLWEEVLAEHPPLERVRIYQSTSHELPHRRALTSGLELIEVEEARPNPYLLEVVRQSFDQVLRVVDEADLLLDVQEEVKSLLLLFPSLFDLLSVLLEELRQPVARLQLPFPKLRLSEALGGLGLRHLRATLTVGVVQTFFRFL